MPTRKHLAKYVIAGFFLIGLGAMIMAGCASSENQPANAIGSMPTTRQTVTMAPTKGRAQIWAESCARCHNSPPPDRYSSAEWQVAMEHMRIRGYLTGEEHDRILEFLQASK
jgi:cytochrome c5